MCIRFPIAQVVLGSLLLFVLSACSDDEPASPEGTTPPEETTVEASPSPVPALCSSVEDLETSVEELTEVDIEDDGADALTQSLEDVESALADVQQEAEETFSSDIAAIQSSIGDLEAVVQQLQGGASAQDVASEAASALSSLSGSVSGLVATSEDQGCNLSS